ncbi:hypothetical protein [Pontixanthobacter sp. CEM42]|uniref:hypothetical protein n=1 Tax=Pontixanthobacter sp. CEM42 TaxID=2792077 RepID=UPI001ADF6E54|nr:hypothetical protein [Pontixanthobacter sp. CEM42]
MYIPPRGSDGLRRTINYGLSKPQTLWNLRSALNVAALNCLDPQYVSILPAYRSLLERHRNKLKRTNDSILAQYRADYGRTYRAEYDGYMTQVYNYYALPPAKTQFCRTAAAIANESLTVEVGQLDLFASINLPRIEQVFDNFYSAYEKYQVDVVAWDAEYAPKPVPVVASSVGQLVPAQDVNQVTGLGATQPVGPSPIGPSITPDATIYTVDVPPSASTAPVISTTLPPVGTVDASTAAPSITLPSPTEPVTIEAPNDTGIAPGFTLSQDPVTTDVTVPTQAPATQPVFVSNPVVQPTLDEEGISDGGEGGDDVGNGIE